MSGCPYNKYDFKLREEVCKITDKQTGGAMVCDFGFEECPHYKEAQKTINPKKQEYYQPDLFGGSVKL